MMALILSFLSNPTVLAVLAGIAAFFGYGFHQRRAGAAKERQKRASERLRARETADEVDNDIGAMTPEQRRERLRKWAR